jgi:hypothetical protein
MWLHVIRYQDASTATGMKNRADKTEANSELLMVTIIGFLPISCTVIFKSLCQFTGILIIPFCVDIIIKFTFLHLIL